MLRPQASPGPAQYPLVRLLEGRAGTGDTGHGCTRKAWGLGTRTGHVHLVRGVAREHPLTHPQELRRTQAQRCWCQRHLSPQQRLLGRPLNPASCQGRRGEEWPRGLKDHLEPLEEQAKETEERSGLAAEVLLVVEGRVPHSARGTRKRLDSRKSLSVCPRPVSRNLQNAAWLRKERILGSQSLNQKRNSSQQKKKSLPPQKTVSLQKRRSERVGKKG